jgi:hypothetical protein
MAVAKTNDPGSLSDYRHISILPVLSKAIMRNQITSHIERNVMMSWFQSGFRSNHNTTPALLKITNDLLLASEEKIISILVLLDFSKAFDGVDHQLFCSKLSWQYKFSTSVVDLIRSYLCGRMQWVWIGSQSYRVSYRDQFCAHYCFFHYSSTISRAILYHVKITCIQTTYNFKLAAVLHIMLIVSVDLTSTLTIYYSGHCETAS